MELWIRSQDRGKLVKVDNLYIKGINIYQKINDELIYGSALGRYKTEERALEVLDEITDFIDGLNKTNTITIFQMPEE